jgi:DNA mismatch repair protein MutS2
MAIRHALYRRRLEQQAEDRMRATHGRTSSPTSTLLSRRIRRLLAGESISERDTDLGEFADLPMPDLLDASPMGSPEPGRLMNLIDLAFLGRASAGELDEILDGMEVGESRWQQHHFAEDLFLEDLVRRVVVELAGRRVPLHLGFIQRVLANPPGEPDTIAFRQAVLAELESNPPLAEAADDLSRLIVRLLSMLRASRDDARLEPVRFRFDVLRAFRRAVEAMSSGFGTASSGLRRLHRVADTIRASKSFRRMEALLDHDQSMAHLEIETIIGADGRMRHLEIRKLSERRKNPFFRRPIRRWLDRFRIAYHRYRLGSDELVDRLVMGVYHEIAPAMARVVQTMCHLEVYLFARGMASRARSRGLEVCLPRIDPANHLELEALFNPLLLAITDRPVPTDVVMDAASPITLVTGPNSGGKTRLLQAIGIAQTLGQSGLFVPCRSARMPLVAGLFASIVESDRADQSEGRLGTEMVRLRTLFENAPPRSLVLLDELCSGTNPSEAVEIVELVLRMLRRIDPVAFVTTHFLDFAHQLRSEPIVESLGFLQAEVDPEQGATFRFIPGVAATSLAVGTARRLGVTFDELERKLARRTESSES